VDNYRLSLLACVASRCRLRRLCFRQPWAFLLSGAEQERRGRYEQREWNMAVGRVLLNAMGCASLVRPGLGICISCGRSQLGVSSGAKGLTCKFCGRPALWDSRVLAKHRDIEDAIQAWPSGPEPASFAVAILQVRAKYARPRESVKKLTLAKRAERAAAAPTPAQTERDRRRAKWAETWSSVLAWVAVAARIRAKR
jgi:hypothetical protein